MQSLLKIIKDPSPFAPLILRVGVSLLFLWFGFSQLLNATAWISWVPQWASSVTHLDVSDIVILNGSFEIIAGSFLAIGIWVRWTALILALHMFLIVFDIGINPIGMRDLAIGISTLALASFASDQFTLDWQVDKS